MGADTGTDWLLHLYISGKDPKLERTVAQLEQICKEHYKGKGAVTVIDVLREPLACMEENILATPTLLKKRPEPVRRIIGDLSDRAKVLSALQISGHE